MKVSLPIINMNSFNIDSCVRVDELLALMKRKKGDNQFIRAVKHFRSFIRKLK